MLQHLFSNATKYHQIGNLSEAENLYRQILNINSNHPDALHLLGLICSQKNDPEEGINLIKKATKIIPNNPMYKNNLGEALRRNKNYNQAIKVFKETIKLAPDFPEPYYNIGTALTSVNKLREAVENFEKAIKLNPNHFKAYYNLGNTFLKQGMYKSALKSFKQAVKIKPNYYEAHNNLAATYKHWDQFEESIYHFKKAMEINPNFDDPISNLSGIYEAQGKIKEAKELNEKLMKLYPNNYLLKLSTEIMPNIIFSSNESIDAYQKNVLETVKKSNKYDFNLPLKELIKESFYPPFNMNYQGRNDLEIKLEFAKLYESVFEKYRKPNNFSNQKKHIGIVVTSGHEGVFLKCLRGIINNFSDKFKYTIICSEPNGKKIIQPAIENEKVDYLSISNEFDIAIDQIRNNNFDLLYYWEIGSDIVNYFLPFLKLAKIQCTSWGWPTTSANPNVDYYLSHKYLETEKSSELYTEKLIRFKHIPTYYYKPPVPEYLKPISHFDLPENKNIYLCSQNLRKIHPDFDHIVAKILENDPDGIALFINDKQENITNLVKDRYKKYPDIYNRVFFMNRMEEREYLNLVKLSDVILDTTHYGGGANTCLDAFICEKPIVTLPNEFHRSRYATATYKIMEIEDCIANDENEYINLANKLANDKDFHKAIVSKIKDKSKILFENIKSVKELENFFSEVLI